MVAMAKTSYRLTNRGHMASWQASEGEGGEKKLSLWSRKPLSKMDIKSNWNLEPPKDSKSNRFQWISIDFNRCQWILRICAKWHQAVTYGCSFLQVEQQLKPRKRSTSCGPPSPKLQRIDPIYDYIT